MVFILLAFKGILSEFLTLKCVQIFIKPVNIMFSCNSMPTFHYKYVLLITHNIDKIMTNNSVYIIRHVHEYPDQFTKC